MQRRVGAYAKLLSNYPEDDAIIAAGEKAELLFVRGLAFCATSDSDGFITEGQLQRVVGAGMRDATARARTLVREGLWEAVDGGYVVRSWVGINGTAQEKGRKRRTDRERKRRERGSESEESPSGHDTGQVADTERNPSGVTPESLNCTVVTEVVNNGSPVKSSQVHGSSGTDRDTTAQTIVGEWIDRAPKRPPQQVVGHVARLAGGMLAEGIDPDDIRRGIAAWMTKGLHPSTLPSVVNEVMNAPPRAGRASTKANGWLTVDQPHAAALEGPPR